MKRKILLVDGYNMIAFWQETRQLFQKSELDAARNILLQKLSHYASFEGIKDTDDFDPFKASIMAQFLQEDVARRIELTFLKELAGLLPEGNHIVAVNQ